MKKMGWILMIIIFLFISGCSQQTGLKDVNLMVNGVKIEGHHKLDSKNHIVIDATNVAWMNPSKIPATITEDQLANRFAIIKEHYDKSTNTYQMVLLPTAFHYATDETDQGQLWVDATHYPKGMMIMVKDYSLVFAVTEITPKQDYTMKKDQDGYTFGQFDEDILGGLPTPSSKSIEVQDYADGHVGMTNISHYSVQINFQN